MEKSTTIIDAQTSLLRELRETYVVLCNCYSSDESAAAKVAILRRIEKLALATLPVSPSVSQQMKPPAAEICKVTHDVVRIRNDRNGQHGWENHAAAFCGISPKTAVEVWDAAVAKARPIIAEAKTAKPKLAIGQTWRTRSGEVGVIEQKSVSRFFCRFGPDLVRSYDAEGNYGSVISELDLVEFIIDEDTNATD